MSKIIKEDPSWVTKYNGFNNGKDASDGVGGRRIPLQIKTMSKTKEFILSHNAAVPKPQLAGVYQAMDEYAAQVLSEYKEKLKAEIRHVRSKSNFEISGGVLIQMIDRL